jgi:enoyl-CoA hydratase
MKSISLLRPFVRSAKRTNFKGIVRLQSNETTKPLVEVEWPADKIAVIKLNSPHEMNALTEDMGDEFTRVVQYLTKEAHEQRLRAVILRGAGGSFSAGGNLNWLKARSLTSGYENSSIMMKFYKRFLCIKDLPVPTIAAIHGFAIGAGCCLTLACDMRLVTNNASLGFTFPKLGIHPGMGASLLLRRVVSGDYANYLLLTGQVIKGQEAFRRGLALDAFDTEDAMFAKALDIAHILAGNSPIAVQGTAQTLRNQKVRSQ